MRAFGVRSIRADPSILDIALPATTSPDDVLVKVAVAGVNPIDAKRLSALSQTDLFPFVPGVDFAGTVAQASSSTSDFAVGDRVFGMARRQGSYADFVLGSNRVAGEVLGRIPDGVSFEQAATLPVAGLTAAGSLALLALKPYQTLVVIGAAGSVGGYAVQLARALEVKVIGVVRGDADDARQLGAESVYDSAEPDVIGRIHRDHPGGVDAVLDVVSSKDSVSSIAGVLRPNGALVSTLHAADVSWFSKQGLRAFNISADVNPVANRVGLEELARSVESGQLTTRIAKTYNIYQSAEIIAALRQGALKGKAVIEMEGQ